MLRAGRLPAAVGLLLCAVVTACGSPSSPLLRADPQAYLIGLDQLPSPDFTVSRGPEQASPDQVLPGNGQLLAGAGFQAAATVTFFRQDASLVTTNGPIEIISTVVRLATTGGAATSLTAVRHYIDGMSGAVPLSTGPLGDEAHATSRVVDDGGYRAIEMDVVWRYVNVLNVLVVRGRYGGARLDDALAIAHQQTANEVTGGAPSPVITATPGSPAATASPAPTATPTPQFTLAP